MTLTDLVILLTILSTALIVAVIGWFLVVAAIDLVRELREWLYRRRIHRSVRAR